ncbi:MAG: helix-hairpin-helix domain-containing protein [Sterolibacterium sp.]
MKKLLYVVFAWFVAIQWAFAAVNINTASEAELDKLPGIGPVKAKAIIEDRTKNGLFKTADDLKRVKGIGDKNFEKLKSEITVDAASAAPKAEAKPAAAPAVKPAAASAEVKKDAAKPEAKPSAKK